MQSGTKVILYGAGATLVTLAFLVMMAVGFANASVAVLADFTVAIVKQATPEPTPEVAPKPVTIDWSSTPAVPRRAHREPAPEPSTWLPICWQIVKWLNIRPYF